VGHGLREWIACKTCYPMRSMSNVMTPMYEVSCTKRKMVDSSIMETRVSSQVSSFREQCHSLEQFMTHQ
jgi:hypothetical protein